MPTYGYECVACTNQIEVFQSIKDDPLTKCDECGGTLRKRIYPVGIAFKGPGFYVNDYGAKPKGGSENGGSAPVKSETAGTASGESKTETKTESTPESTAESKPAKVETTPATGKA